MLFMKPALTVIYLCILSPAFNGQIPDDKSDSAPSEQSPAPESPSQGQPPAAELPPLEEEPSTAGSPPLQQPPAAGSSPLEQPPDSESPPAAGSPSAEQPPVAGSPPAEQPPAAGSPTAEQPPVAESPPAEQPPAAGAPPAEQPLGDEETEKGTIPKYGPKCPPGWFKISNKCMNIQIRFNYSYHYYTESERECTEMGFALEKETSLATFPTKLEQQILTCYLYHWKREALVLYTPAQLDQGPSWFRFNIGLKRSNITGVDDWSWVDGTPKTDINWAFGHPAMAYPITAAYVSAEVGYVGQWGGAYSNYTNLWANNGFICQFVLGEKEEIVICPDGWFGFEKKCYKVYKDVNVDLNPTFNEAKTKCATEGESIQRNSTLASIHSQEENDYLACQTEVAEDNLYLGLRHDDVGERKYGKWVDNTPLVQFTNWVKGYPLEDKGRMHCVMMKLYGAVDYLGYEFGRWQDVKCEVKYPILCQIDTVDEVQAGLSNIRGTGKDIMKPAVCPEEWFRIGDTCVRFDQRSNNYHEATAECSKDGLYVDQKTTLAMLKTKSDQAEVSCHIHFRNYKRPMWIGLKETNEGDWSWIDYKLVTDANWDIQQPDNTGQKEACAMIWSTNSLNLTKTHNPGKWNDWFCNATTDDWSAWWKEVFFASEPMTGYLCQFPLVGGVEIPKKVECPEKWFLSGEDCYQINREKRTFYNAKRFCVKEGEKIGRKANLAIFHNHAELENAVCHNMIDLDYDEFIWIGIQRPKTGGNYTTWIDGSNIIYQNWEIGKPNVSDITRHCVIMDSKQLPRGKWIDEECNKLFGFICMLSNETIPPTPEPPLTEKTPKMPQCPDGWFRIAHTCNKFNDKIDRMLQYKEAEALCEQEQQREKIADIPKLAIFRTTEEHQLIACHLRVREHAIPMWIGLKQSDDLNDWQWVDGSLVTDENWQIHKPQEPRKNLSCGYVQNKNETNLGYWYDYPCDEPRENIGFVCQFSLYDGPPPVTKRITCPKDWYRYENACYKAIHEKEPYYQAMRRCKNIGLAVKRYAELTSIHDRAESEYVVCKDMELGNYNDSVWVGLRRPKIGTDTYNNWVDGTAVKFVNYADGRPLLTNTSRQCIAIDSNYNNNTRGQWFDEECNILHGYVCKISNDSIPPGVYSNPPNDIKKVDCHVNWTSIVNKCVKVVIGNYNYDSAQAKCKGLSTEVGFDTNLAVMPTEEEQQLLSCELSIRNEKYKNTPLWLGLTETKDGIDFIWLNNEPVSDEHWRVGRPQRIEQDKLCVYASGVEPIGQWIDAVCDNPNGTVGFVCQYDPYKGNPPSVGRVVCPEKWVRYENDCYFFNKLNLTYYSATKACEKMASDIGWTAQLAIIKTKNEQDFLTCADLAAGDFKNNSWIGMRRPNTGGDYAQWIDKTPVAGGFTNWQIGRPIKDNNNLHCVAIDARREGRWYDTSCVEEIGSICKLYGEKPTSTAGPTTLSFSTSPMFTTNAFETTSEISESTTLFLAGDINIETTSESDTTLETTTYEATETSVVCEMGFVNVNNECFKDTDTPANYEDYEKDSIENGEEPPTFKSKSDMAKILAQLYPAKDGVKDVWLRLNQKDITEGNFEWDDGEPTGDVRWPGSTTGSKCIYTDTESLKLKTADCNEKKHYVKKQLKDVSSTNCDSSWTTIDKACIKLFGDQSETWQDAENECQKSGANLISFRSPDEIKLIKDKMMGNSPKDSPFGYWVGLNSDSSGEFKWSNGRTVFYPFWERHIDTDIDYRVCAYTDFEQPKLKSTQNCEEKKSYACKKYSENIPEWPMQDDLKEKEESENTTPLAVMIILLIIFDIGWLGLIIFA